MEYGQVHHIEYYVNDLNQTKKFWSWFMPRMGYAEYQSWNSGISYAHKINKTYLVFVEVEPEHLQYKNNRQAMGLNHIAFHGCTQNDLDLLTLELKEHNVKILTQKKGVVCFEDSNDFAVEFFATNLISYNKNNL
jgi:catechol 2,3-dioxygenase-like lactoylglutathione lyase family enzyme